MNLTINPETKVGALLEAYPNLEADLIGLAPAFAKLTNRTLREAVVQVATLSQAAQMVGINAHELVAKLRVAAGQNGLAVADEPAAAPDSAPDWLKSEQVRHRIDADAMLATGVHPLGSVQEAVVSLEVGEIVELTSGFRPQPLLDAMAQSGLAVYSHETAPGRHASYFSKQSADPSIAERVGRSGCSGSCG